MLARQIQRLMELEDVYAGMASRPDLVAATSQDALAAADPASRMVWADAANVSVAELLQQVQEGRAARERIVASNVRLVCHAVKQLKRGSGGRLDQGTTEADLVQEGCIAVLRAAERFDVSMGVRFSTYATFWVRAAIRRALQEQSRVVRLPARVHVDYGKIKRAQQALQSTEGKSSPSDTELSAELQANGVKLSPEKVRQVIGFVSSRPSSLDRTLNGRKAGETSSERAVDLIRDEKTHLEAGVVQSMLNADLKQLMERHLRPEEVQVLTLRFGLGDNAPRTVREVAEEVQVSYTKAKNLLFSALTKMRKPHVSLALRDYVWDDGQYY